MSFEQDKERLLDLLADRALCGLNDEETAELLELETRFPDLADDDSFDIAAAAFSLNGIGETDELPASLRSRLLADAEKFSAGGSTEAVSEAFNETAPAVSKIQYEKPGFSFGQWLGWGVAAIACIALVFNVWLTRYSAQEQAKNNTPTTEATPSQPTAEEQLNQLLASAKDAVKTNWTSPVEGEDLSGEVVWSDAEQKGYMTFKGLAPNDASKESYQLWIFDETQDDKTPIDGGVFNVNKKGEVVVPIDAKLRVSHPKMFAVTVEKPGGVVVSKREKIVALAKV